MSDRQRSLIGAHHPVANPIAPAFTVTAKADTLGAGLLTELGQRLGARARAAAVALIALQAVLKPGGHLARLVG